MNHYSPLLETLENKTLLNCANNTITDALKSLQDIASSSFNPDSFNTTTFREVRLPKIIACLACIDSMAIGAIKSALSYYSPLNSTELRDSIASSVENHPALSDPAKKIATDIINQSTPGSHSQYSVKQIVNQVGDMEARAKEYQKLENVRSRAAKLST